MRIILLLAAIISFQLAFAYPVTLTWNDNSDNEDGFSIFYGTAPYALDQELKIPPQESTGKYTYTLNGLNYGLQYYFKVRAFNEFGESGYTNMATYERPPTPRNFRIITSFVREMFPGIASIVKLDKVQLRSLDKYLRSLKERGNGPYNLFSKSQLFSYEIDIIKKTCDSFKLFSDKAITQDILESIDEYFSQTRGKGRIVTKEELKYFAMVEATSQQDYYPFYDILPEAYYTYGDGPSENYYENFQNLLVEVEEAGTGTIEWAM